MPDEKPAPTAKPKKQRIGCFGHIMRNIRISIVMLRSIYYVGRTGIHHGRPHIYWEASILLFVSLFQECFSWYMTKRISMFYQLTSVLLNGEKCPWKEFLGQFVIAAIFYASVQGFEAYVKGLISVKLRQSLSDWFQSLYFERLRLPSPQHPPLIDNCDQRMTEDIREVATGFVHVYSILLFQPVFLSYYLWYAHSLFNWSPLILGSYFIFSVMILRFTLNPVFKQTARAEKAEADFRLIHVLAKNRAEAISISAGGQIIREDADKKFLVALDIQGKLNRYAGFNEVFKNFFNYTNAIWAYGFVFLIFGAGYKVDSFQGPSTASMIATRLMDALGKMSLINSLFTSVPVASAHALRLIELARRLEYSGNGPEPQNGLQEVVISNLVPATIPASVSQRRTTSAVFDAVSISFESVDLYCPNEQLLVYAFSVRIWPGQNTIIYGPSGSGKSSLIRCLSGIWKCRHGNALVIAPPGLTRPPIMYAPQVPVIVSGSIIDQLYYPYQPPPVATSPEEIEEQYDSVKQCLEAVGMYKLFNQRLQGSITKELSSSEWHELMSPGELQRLVLARFFLHLPVFAIMDEATNAIDSPKEQEIYELLWAAGITTVSVSHRMGFVKDTARIAVFLDGQGNHQIDMK